MNRTRKNKDVLSMNNNITFHRYDQPNELNEVKKIFPELTNEEIVDALISHNYNIDATVEDLLSLRFIRQTISSNDIKRNSKILEIYNDEVQKPSQEIVFNKNNPAVLNNISDSYINIPNNKQINASTKEPKESQNQTTLNGNINNENEISHHKKKRNRRRHSKKVEKAESDNDSATSTTPDSEAPNLQRYFKVSEVKSMFPDISDRLLILTLQVNKGDIDEVVNFLLMQNNIKEEINEEDLCRSLELQLENEYNHGKKPSCDGNCITQGYPCYLHSRLFLTKEEEYNTLSLSEIMKVWNKFELRDANIQLDFSDQMEAIKYYTEDNEEIEFMILNRIKEAEKAMTPEERLHQDDVEYFRKREEQLKGRKHKYFNEASRKYRERNLTGFSSAAYYSEEGRQLKDEIEKVKLLAVSAQIRKNEKSYMQNNGLSSFCGVDLHGLTVKEAIAYLNDMLNIWKTEVMKHHPKYQKKAPAASSVIRTTTETHDFGDNKCKSFSKVVASAPKAKPDILHNVKITKVDSVRKKKAKCLYPRIFNIITGRGIHSDANIGARLKPSIINYLKNNQYDFVEINSGSIEVRL